jgi:hypothetical protein
MWWTTSYTPYALLEYPHRWMSGLSPHDYIGK